MAIGMIETCVITQRSGITRKKSNDRSWFWPKTRENGQRLAFVESVKAGKHMKGRDQGKARSTARNSFAEQTCSMEGSFPNYEMVKS